MKALIARVARDLENEYVRLSWIELTILAAIALATISFHTRIRSLERLARAQSSALVHAIEINRLMQLKQAELTGGFRQDCYEPVSNKKSRSL